MKSNLPSCCFIQRVFCLHCFKPVQDIWLSKSFPLVSLYRKLWCFVSLPFHEGERQKSSQTISQPNTNVIIYKAYYLTTQYQRNNIYGLLSKFISQAVLGVQRTLLPDFVTGDVIAMVGRHFLTTMNAYRQECQRENVKKRWDINLIGRNTASYVCIKI